MGMQLGQWLFVICTGIPFVAVHAQSQTVSLLFGPATEAAAAKAATAAAQRVTEWLSKPGRAVEVRRAGSRDGQELLKFMKPPVIEKTLLDAAREAQGNTETAYLNALEVATYSLGRATGARVLVTLLESPKFGRDGEARLQQILGDCKSKSIRVIAVELSGQAAAEGMLALEGLASGTGGQWARTFEDLDTALGAVVPIKAGPAITVVKPSGVTIPPPSNELQVHARLVKTSPIRISKIGAKLGPMNGLLIVQTPMRALSFSTSGGNYQARARVSAVIKDPGGTVVWQGTKDYAVKGPANKLEARKRGELYYVREVQLTAGQYSLEAKIEDLTESKSAETKVEIVGTNSLPGLSASDAMFVRKFDRSIDAMQGDSVISYDGEALAPLLDPAFVANEPFELGLFFLFYPDMNGKQPVLTLDIRSGGQSVGTTQLAFTDSLRDDSRTGSGSAFAGEQKGQFPYLAKIANATFDVGRYEAVIELKQDSVVLKRDAAFRVYKGQ
ncbi:hypothetical protein [uncultured Paludibaculum sp.]|uniref:hypothetical protein n=1 Tax=uncultured Paludibaculum sp. TaxID=1765020 RepID=UPI002AABA6CE|nr:hypothetical protein [uncultured Paludibaculum sp.]